jgi:hypothetical protein
LRSLILPNLRVWFTSAAGLLVTVRIAGRTRIHDRNLGIRGLDFFGDFGSMNDVWSGDNDGSL